MNNNIFSAISQWKDFERLSADLLEAEGYKLKSEPIIDRTGIDLEASKEYRSHDGDTISINWIVQCKHYAVSGNSLGRKETEEILNSYLAVKKVYEGLLLMVDSDYTEEAKVVVDKFLINHPDARIELWNQRQLRSRLERHPHLLARYGLRNQSSDYLSLFSEFKRPDTISVLIISDQSAFAHNLKTIFRSLAFDVTVLPFWNYQPSTREILLVGSLTKTYNLIVVFLGDSFGLPIPNDLLSIIKSQFNTGASLLIFPFVAWSMNQGAYSILDDIVPVRLIDPSHGGHLFPQRITGEYRSGDFRWMLAFDSFAEDQYVELDPKNSSMPFTNGIEERFGISHSFEYLRLTQGAECAWSDTTGNPIIVTKNQGLGKVCYLNTCCHSCMTIVPITSPIEASLPFAIMLRNIFKWLLE